MAALAAVFLSVAGCTLPNQQGGQSGNNKNVALVSPVPSPTPTPTQTPAQQFAASAPAFHIGEVGIGYAPVALTATGGVLPYHWNLSGGTLPPGLKLGGDGSVSGKPTAAGKFSFSIEVSDSGDGKAPVTGTVTIAPALNASLLPACTKYCVVELGCSNACGAFGQQTGGVGPFAYSLSQGQVPSGTILAALSLKGTFTGQTGYLQFTVQITDSLGATATVSPTFWMYPHIALASGICTGNYITGCSVQLPISGGIPSDHFSVKLVANNPNPNQGCWNIQAQPPPSGDTLTVSGKNVLVQIPSRIINGYGAVWTVVVTDSALCATSTDCTTPGATVMIGVQCG